jgi:hypothetical protein
LELEVVGVYQHENSVPESREEREMMNVIGRKIENILDKKREVMDNLVLLQSLGVADEVDPYLIHIGYPGEIPRGIIVPCIGDGVGRVSFSRIGQLPDFYDKRTHLFPQLLANFPEVREDGKVREEDKEKIEEVYTTLSEQLRLYGLTRTEHCVLSIAKKIKKRTDGEGRDIISNPLFIKFISGLLN